jgi:hypothetical protein
MWGIPGYRLAWRTEAPGFNMWAMNSAGAYVTWWNEGLSTGLLGQHLAAAAARGVQNNADALETVAHDLAVLRADSQAALALLDQFSVTLTVIARLIRKEQRRRRLMGQQ